MGPTRSLRTDESAPVFSLPDNRGWEMVSPTEKNGGEIQGFGGMFGGGVLQAAAQGGADHLHVDLLFRRAAGLARGQPVRLDAERHPPGRRRT